ncbi:hypothetical protein WICPIJ_001856 [Wickerhamomyces pijperi]|uniref:FAD-binding FR-type domain-containing protein n=1 Tax=Wickerhamomyces pijperi TaxID=599730 RepID=A0A9P8TQQ8_WICPI|nr:hypothetical protein WICPIJ_001856 [Wickerhamomyces pijperi]
MSETIEGLVKRHGEHHKVNIKYGYILFVLTVILYLIFHQFPRLIPITQRLRNYITLFLLLLSYIIIQNYNSLSDASVYTKRLARLSVALLPLDFFLTLKVPGVNAVDYLGLVWLHKWVSRVIVAGGAAHGIAYVVLFFQKNELSHLLRFLNILGVVAWFGFIAMVVISLRTFRRKIYKWFYSVHVVLAYSMLILIQFHARPGVSLFTLINAAVIIYSIAVKFLYSSTLLPTEFQHIERENSDLCVVEIINCPFLDDKTATNGGHLRISGFSPKNPLYYLNSSHPYTMIKHNNSVKLVIKRTNFSIPKGSSLTTFGPFASAVPTPIPNSSKLLFIAGGSGISFTLSLYQQYRQQPDVQVRFVWVIRDIRDLWVLNEFGVDPSSTKSPVEVYVTNSKSSEIQGNEQRVGLMNDVELDEFQSKDELSKSLEADGRIKFHKPFIPELIADFFGDDTNSTGSIISCGSQSMNAECEEAVNTEPYKERGIVCYNEVYEM